MQCCMEDVLPFLMMMIVECVEVGTMTLVKAAMNNGMSQLVYVVYSNLLGTIVLFPFFAVHNHRSNWPPITSLIFRYAILGLLGIGLLQPLAYAGINYSSPSLATALGNMLPAYTYLIAIILKMEKLDLKSSSSRAKSLGTIIAISGAFLLTFYKGPEIFQRASSDSSDMILMSQPSYWVLGGLILVTTGIISSTWNVLQTATVREHPDEITMVFYVSLFGTIQCATFSLGIERNLNSWVLSPGIEIVAVVFGGFMFSWPRLSRIRVARVLFFGRALSSMKNARLSRTTLSRETIYTLVLDRSVDPDQIQDLRSSDIAEGSICVGISQTRLNVGPEIFQSVPNESSDVILLSQPVILETWRTYSCSHWHSFFQVERSSATVRLHPDEITMVFYVSCFGAIECAIIERNQESWVLNPGIEIVAVVLGVGVIFLCSLVAVVMGILFLGDALYLGSSFQVSPVLQPSQSFQAPIFPSIPSTSNQILSPAHDSSLYTKANPQSTSCTLKDKKYISKNKEREAGRMSSRIKKKGRGNTRKNNIGNIGNDDHSCSMSQEDSGDDESLSMYSLGASLGITLDGNPARSNNDVFSDFLLEVKNNDIPHPPL
ncbi:WAT1-related protein isoform X1 [Tanacetum coccineum]